MFDAKSLLDALVRGAQPAPAQGQGGTGGLGDLLGQLGKLGGGQQGGGAGGLGDLLGKMMQQGGGAPSAPGGSQGGGLGDLLGKMQQMGPGGQGGPQGAQGAPNILDILGQVLGQATQGVREGAGKADQATGAGDKLREMLQQTTGKSPDELLAQIQELIKNNQLGAGAALGGLGALILGTRTGRSVATGAVKLGALALIGGLAYKAYQNYTQGKPMLGGQSQLSEAAPAGSGFEPGAISNEAAIVYIRAMIAAAAADGRIDAAEQKKIMSGLEQAGMEQAAVEFLRREMQSPASVEDLAAGVSSQEEAVQVLTAARLAVDLDNQAESDFLTALAAALQIEPGLLDNIDKAARAAA